MKRGRDKHREPYALRREGPAFCVLVRVLEADMMIDIRNKAKRDKTSIAEAIRTLLTWGLEIEDGGRAASERLVASR